MWKRERVSAETASTTLLDAADPTPAQLSVQIALSLGIPARDAEELLALGCAIRNEAASALAELEHGRLTDRCARLLADAAAELAP